MKSAKSALIYGFFVWLIPFVVSFLIYPFHSTERPLFESIMPVIITVAVVFFTVRYFKQVERDYFKEGILLGLVFFTLSILIDLLMFSKGPMAMPLIDYVKDIGLTYLMIPVITSGFGYILDQKQDI